MLESDLDDRPEVLVPALRPDIPRIDPILCERTGTLWMSGQEEVSIIMEITDDRDSDPLIGEARDDLGDRSRGCIVVDGDPDELAPSLSQLGDLCRRRDRISRVGIRHRLHHDRVPTPHRYRAYIGRYRLPPPNHHIDTCQ